MNLTNIPTLVAVPFASGAGAGYRNTIPVPSQIPTTPGAASYTDGFVPVNFQPIASGGVPPFGEDFNGILNDLSVANRWNQAGGRYYFDATFSAAITGYPKGATLNRTDNLGAWLNTVDNNTTDPNSTSSAGWVPVRANAVAVSITVSAGANTPTKEKLGSQVIVCTGAIASAATLVLPLTAGAVYVVHNNTTGAGALTVIGATGSGVTIPQTVGYYVYTDGTNFYGASADVSGLYLPSNGTAVAATKLAAARSFALTGQATGASAAGFDGTGNLAINVTALAPTGSQINEGLGYTAANDGSVVHTSGNEAIGGSKTFTSNLLAPSAALANGAIGTQVGQITYGWATGTKVWGVYLEPDTSYSLYAYTTAGGFLGRTFNLTQAGTLTVPGSVACAGLASSGNVTANTNFVSSNTFVVIAPASPGSILLRAAGVGNGTQQVSVDSSGNLNAYGQISGANLSGSNTGDQNLTPYALLSGAAFTGAISSTTVHASSTIMAAGGFQIG